MPDAAAMRTLMAGSPIRRPTSKLKEPPMALSIRNRWHFAAAVTAFLAYGAHVLMGGAAVLGRMVAPGAGQPEALAFNLWNSAGAVLFGLGVVYTIASFSDRARLLAGFATIAAVFAAVLPAVFVGFHHQPELAVAQILAFGLMALLGMVGVWRGGRPVA